MTFFESPSLLVPWSLPLGAWVSVLSFYRYIDRGLNSSGLKRNVRSGRCTVHQRLHRNVTINDIIAWRLNNSSQTAFRGRQSCSVVASPNDSTLRPRLPPSNYDIVNWSNRPGEIKRGVPFRTVFAIKRFRARSEHNVSHTTSCVYHDRIHRVIWTMTLLWIMSCFTRRVWFYVQTKAEKTSRVFHYELSLWTRFHFPCVTFPRLLLRRRYSGSSWVFLLDRIRKSNSKVEFFPNIESNCLDILGGSTEVSSSKSFIFRIRNSGVFMISCEAKRRCARLQIRLDVFTKFFFVICITVSFVLRVASSITSLVIRVLMNT